ncbi:hypothetical protein ACVNPS_06245 [Candidatus Bipolaricaulota sp. J31]
MHGVTVGRIRKDELTEVIAMWKYSFRGELGVRMMDLSDIEPIFRFLLSLRRAPLSFLHRLGVPVEIWVLRMGGKPVGGVGQIGYRIPYIIGLVVEEGKRSLRLVRLIDQGITEGLRRAGYALMRALVPHGHPIVRLGIKLGWELLGTTRQFVLPLERTSPEAGTLGERVHPLSFREEHRFACLFQRAHDVRSLLAVERNYGSPWARLFGFRERVLVARRGSDPTGVARISWNAYQPVGFMGVPHLKDEYAYRTLLAYAIGFLARLGKAELHLDLWEEQAEAIGYVHDLGAEERGRWIYMIKRL